MSRGRNVAAIVLVLVATALGVSSRWLASLREIDHGFAASSVFTVTSSEDVGLGTLRQAIFDANLAEGPAQIVLRAADITVRSPLPPLVNPRGILLDGRRAEIRAEELEDGPLFDVATPRTIVSNLTIHGVKGAAVRVLSGTFVGRSLTITGCGTGLQFASAIQASAVQKCRFDGNGTGIMVLTEVPLSVGGSAFSHNRSAGIWAVVPSADGTGPVLEVKDNEFTEDRIGLAIFNVRANVTSNRFAKCLEAGVFLSGRGAELRDNRVRSGTIGILAEQTHGLVLENNEVDHNASMGILLRSSSRALVRGNRLHENGYGVAVILGEARTPNLLLDNVILGEKLDGFYLLGSSPSLRNNQVLSCGAAGVRALGYFPSTGKSIPSEPTLENNTLRGNVDDTLVRGEYRVPPTGAGSS